MSWLLGLFAMLGAGCSSSIRVLPSELPELVREYHRTGRAKSPTKKRPLTREQRPLLYLEGEYCPSWKTRCQPEMMAELDRVRVSGDTLLLPEQEPARPDRVQGAQIGASRETLRHRVGLQAGGTGFLQFVYRYRLVGPLALDVGALAVTHAFNGSAGLVLEGWLSPRWSTYLGLGGGAGAVFGLAQEDGCDPEISECEAVTHSTTVAFGYARVGLGLHLGRFRRSAVGLDVGGWYGQLSENEEATHQRGILWPMAGLSYLWAF